MKNKPLPPEASENIDYNDSTGFSWCRTDEKTRELEEQLKTQTLILRRQHLLAKYNTKTIEEISLPDFLYMRTDDIRLAELVVFIDNNGDTRIMKNRYGALGILKHKP